MLDMKYYERYYFSKSKCVPYQLKCGVEINIYPILVEDIETFEDCIDILLIDKDSIDDPNIIKMKYIEFLKNIQFNLSEKIEGTNLTYGQNQQIKFITLMTLCLKEDYVDIDYDKNKCVVVIGEEKDDKYILKAKITNKEFEEISKIILYQNIRDYDDKKLDPTVQKLYEDYIRLKNKDFRNPEIEEKKEYIMAHNGWGEDKINKLTYRRFCGIFDCLIGDALYYGNKIIEGSEKFECKKVSTHFMFEKKQNKYDDFVVNGDSIKDKIG